jgi:NADP-dependent 3-hydroxy acid dehydrogenase YdfG
VDLTGKTAIVSGASSGIGAATVRMLREAGVRVAGGARRVERIRPLHVNLDEIVIKAIAQSSGSHVVRRST